jgi:hypothetical protein
MVSKRLESITFLNFYSKAQKPCNLKIILPFFLGCFFLGFCSGFGDGLVLSFDIL